MEDQITCNFWFKITPTKILPNAKSKLAQNQSVLIKLGNRQAKCKTVGSSAELNVDVLFSQTLNKYCPIKGIIKVYDVNSDGSQMISCVGAFNTQDLLCHQHKVSNIERDIGPCKIFLTFEVARKDVEKEFKQATNNSKLKSLEEPIKKNDPFKLSQNSEDSLRSIHNRRFSKSPNVSQSDCHETPYIIDDSSIEDECYQSRISDVSDDFRTHERETMGKELIQQRRKNKLLEEKLQKCNIKIQLLKKNISQKNNEMKSYYQNFKNFTASLQSDSRGQYKFGLNEKTHEITLKYKANINFKQIFEGFIQFMIKKMTENGGIVGSDRTIQDEAEINKVLYKLENFDNEKKRNSDEIAKIRTELNQKKQQLSQKSALLISKNQMLKRKQDQVQQLQQNMNNILEEKNDLEGEIQYLRESYNQMESSLNSKQNLIENLQKKITKNNSDIYFLGEKNKKLQNDFNNLHLKMQEMLEQNQNLQQTIDGYRKQFGDLKATKDKALQREIKQCLRWIEQQNRDEQLSLQEDTTLTFSQSPTVSSFMRSIDEIQKMPQGEIQLIRNQVMSVLKKLDELVVKNSIGGISS